EHPNLMVMQTFSKAWGLAGIRLGMAFASPELIRVFNAVKPPYNVNSLSQSEALRALADTARFRQEVQQIRRERQALAEALVGLPVVRQVFPSDANFLLVQVSDAPAIYRYLVQQGIIVRDRSKQYLCENCLRFTIGTPQENKRLLQALQQFT
ncbi:MAG: histidinol-phosphate aminotransferase family protein, partial [Bacteroidetes bacterium]